MVGWLRRFGPVLRAIEVGETAWSLWERVPAFVKSGLRAVLIYALVQWGAASGAHLLNIGRNNWLLILTTAVVLSAIVWVAIEHYFPFRSPEPSKAPDEQPLVERGTITISEPVYVPEDHIGSDKVVDNEEARKYLGQGVWHEVRWRGWQLPNGYIDADGPYCPRDNEELKFHTGSRDPSPVEDYRIVEPPRTYLVCPACDHKYYLTATERKPQRVGDSRQYAAWRLGGGETYGERIAKLLRIP